MALGDAFSAPFLDTFRAQALGRFRAEERQIHGHQFPPGLDGRATAQGLSVPQQVKWGRGECARFGWADPRVTTDTDIGATRHTVKQRPGYKDLVAGLAEPAPEGKRWVLVTRSSSRANRQLLTVMDVIMEGVLLHRMPCLYRSSAVPDSAAPSV
ncbi:hypothetical protein [Nocardia sp. NBC_00403]|uniref:hypothetical protein n=1 Tax=Nocardia sp. NBC_00403 TaxID=2975990 RepID=UPI002E1CD934